MRTLNSTEDKSLLFTVLRHILYNLDKVISTAALLLCIYVLYVSFKYKTQNSLSMALKRQLVITCLFHCLSYFLPVFEKFFMSYSIFFRNFFYFFHNVIFNFYSLHCLLSNIKSRIIRTQWKDVCYCIIYYMLDYFFITWNHFYNFR